MTWAQLTLIVLVVLTWFFAAAAGDDYTKTGDVANLYPLPQVYREVWPGRAHLPHLVAFSLVAICGMIASYNGMIYAVSRQSFSLGRAGYLPRVLGEVHADRRTPTVSLVVWSAVIAGFVIWSFFRPDVVGLAVLTCNLAALVWYVLAMVSLFILRVREPNMPRPYRVPWYPVLPAAVIVMSLFSAAVYGWLNEPAVLWLTAGMYTAGGAYYFGYARRHLEAAAPEELAARRGS
jgi:ethanolamine permease